jgi:flagellar FliL protein
VSKGLTEEEPVPYDPGDVFITNLKDGSGLVKVRLMLELKNKKAAENLTKVNYRLRDSIISVLREITREDAAKSDIAETLKKDIIRKVGEDLGSEDIVGVYFQEIIVQ